MKSGIRIGICVVMAAMLLVSPDDVFGQVATGALSGTVTDASGAALPGVIVQISGQGNRTVVTDEQGQYVIPALPTGTYTLRASLQGFRDAEYPGIIVTTGLTSNVSVVLEVGWIQETVTVASAIEVLSAETSRVGTDLQSATIEDRLSGTRVRIRTDETVPDDDITERVSQIGFVTTVGRSIGGNVVVFVTGGLAYGDQELKFEADDGMSEIWLGGNRWVPMVRGGVKTRLTPRHSIETGVQFEWGRVGNAVRNPVLSSPGTVNRDLAEIKTSRIGVSGLFHHSVSPTFTLSAGGDVTWNSYTVTRLTDIDFSNVSPGVSLHADVRQELSRTTVRAVGGVEYRPTARICVSTTVEGGPGTWKVVGGLRYSF